MQVMKVYRHEDYDQLKLEMPFGVTLREDNRWVVLSKKFPWEDIDREYQKHFKSSEGQVAISSRLAFGALYIQAEEGYTDEQTRRNIQENPYLQYFCGFECYTMDSPFDASMMTHFRKRICPEMIQRINDLVFAPEAVASMDNSEEEEDDDSEGQTGSDAPPLRQAAEAAAENRGTLILDATCCPADIHYPTDVGLLNHARELVEKMIDLLYPAAHDLYPEKPRTYRQQARKKYLAYTKKRTHTERETRMIIRGNLQYIQRDIGYIEKMIAHGASLSLLGNDLYRKLLVIQELCRQQWDMYARKSHQMEDRIVSIDQPHIRPIVRGKAGCPVEFGAKVIVGLVGGYAFLLKADWNNYSESKSLKQAVEEYKATFGFYPKTILADRAYPSRENRLWCTSLGIRLSGPRLGRKSTEEKLAERKQIYQDGCDRVVIEGTFGVAKRRYGLDRVMTRLPDTSMTSIAMGFFAANMERKLRLLFAPECGWALDYDFGLGELVIFPRFPDVSAIQ
jgi:IS5 family transposase